MKFGILALAAGVAVAASAGTADAGPFRNRHAAPAQVVPLPSAEVIGEGSVVPGNGSGYAGPRVGQSPYLPPMVERRTGGGNAWPWNYYGYGSLYGRQPSGWGSGGYNWNWP